MAEGICPHVGPVHWCIAASGGSSCFRVTAPADCCWSAVPQPGPLRITSGGSACGDGEVCYDVPPNVVSVDGSRYPIQVGDKLYVVGQRRPGTPTSTKTVTAAPRTPTRSAALPTPPSEPTTITPSPSPSPTPPACPGDCDGNGEVTVDELLTLLNVVLSSAPVDACRGGDRDDDRSIDVAEVVLAVTAALDGCGPDAP